ncbi:MAG: glycosyl hydrolase 53 family protein [Steroidobacteraceae bacterium]
MSASILGFRVLAAALSAAVLLAPIRARAEDYAVGADVSFLGRAEQQGVVFSDGGRKQPVLRILHEHGYRWIRLRLFHAPTDLPNNLQYTIALAREAKALGMKLLLDYHYADSWADPQQQPIPTAWAGLSHADLTVAVFEYTRDTMAAFRDAGVLPDMVQIGNEITHGMLWPDGKLPDHWGNLAELIYAGINGVDAGRGNGRRPKIMIHIDRGADMKGTKEFFDKLNSYDVPYDVIGQSYYPWFHGSLNQLRTNLTFMADEYQKDIIVVETAYNWRPTEYLGKPAPFPESPDGQRQFLDELNRVVMQTPNGRGKGIFWWEPAVTGQLSSRGYFDDRHNALPVVGVFDRFTRQ